MVRKSYARAWKPCTPAESVDRKKGVVSEKTRNEAASVFTHNPLGVGSNPTGGIPNSLNLLCEQLSRENRAAGRLSESSAPPVTIRTSGFQVPW
jgi:hypothetical protein